MSAKHYDAFERYAIQERPPAEVAAELGMKVDQLYLIKNRTLVRLRKKMTELFGSENGGY